jgi:hypothetical protein
VQQVQFDAATHTYTLGGRKLPSVTQVLGPLEDYSMVPPDLLEAARIRGQHVHEACDLFDRDELDWQSLDLQLVPFVEAWRNFLHESGAVVIASEVRVVHAQLGYAGSPDKVLSWGKRIVVPDLKATAIVPRTVGAQTAAYAQAYQAMHGCRVPDRYCIHLKDGKYTTHPRRSPTDWTLFLSALNCHNFKEQHRVFTS